MVLLGWSILYAPPYISYGLWSIPILAPYRWLRASRWQGPYLKLQCILFSTVLLLRAGLELWIPIAR